MESTAKISQNPKVSIIIPNYNGEKYLSQAIESCIQQTYENKEIILVDDESSDNSIDIACKFPGLKVIRQLRQGAPAARNNGLNHANGEYIKFLDSDDVLVHDCIALQVEISKSLKIHEITYGDYSILTDDIKSDFSNNIVRKGSLSDIVKYDIMTSTPLHKKKYLEKVKGFDTRLSRGQEWNLHVRLACSGLEFCHKPVGTYLYRKHEAVTRISQQFSIPSHDAVHKNLERYLLTFESTSKLLDDDSKKIIAGQIWALGRWALRNNLKRSAFECFNISIGMHKEGVNFTQSKIYFALYKIFGAPGAESIIAGAKKILGKDLKKS